MEIKERLTKEDAKSYYAEYEKAHPKAIVIGTRVCPFNNNDSVTFLADEGVNAINGITDGKEWFMFLVMVENHAKVQSRVSVTPAQLDLLSPGCTCKIRVRNGYANVVSIKTEKEPEPAKPASSW